MGAEFAADRNNTLYYDEASLTVSAKMYWEMEILRRSQGNSQNDASSNAERDRFGAASRAELTKNGGHVKFHGVLRD